MSLRRFAGRLMLCIAFMLASAYVQAMAHVDEWQVVATVHVANKPLPPCHHAMQGNASKDSNGGHHGCCSNFACAVGLIVDNAPCVLPRIVVIHAIDYGSVARSTAWRPLNPPPKSH